MSWLERFGIGDERLQVLIGDDSAPVGHAHDRRTADHAAGPDEVDDLRVGIELVAKVDPREGRDRLVGRLRVGDAAEAVRAMAVDGAVSYVEAGGPDRGAPGAAYRGPGRSLDPPESPPGVGDELRRPRL